MLHAMGRTINQLIRQFDRLETHELLLIAVVVITIGIIIMWKVGNPN